MRFSLWCVSLLLGWLATGHTLAADGGDAAIPYRRFSPLIDGNVSEWRSPWYAGQIIEAAATPAGTPRVELRLCWDHDSLFVAGIVNDTALIAAPKDLDVDRYHQYDSAQIYLDPLADGGPSMNDDDVDLLLLPDGRQGVLRGDSLIGTLAGATVPQRQSAPLPVEYAAQMHASGWTFELRIPFAGLGLTPMSGSALGIDVVYNDWLVEHPPGSTQALTAERVRLLAQRPGAPEPADAAVGRDVLPRSWSGDTDFGYPERWRRLTLTGQPEVWDAMLQAFGTPRMLLLFGLAGLVPGLGCAVWIRARYRQQLRTLLRRLTPSGDETPTPIAPVLSPSDEDPALEQGGIRDREFADAVLAHVRLHLHEALTPAALAEHFHVSPRTLQRRLKAALNTSPQELVLVARLQTARTLLRSGRYRVGEVASRVGFEDLSYFSRRYRLAFGHAPSAEPAIGHGEIDH